MIDQLYPLFFLLILSAFFSMSETALVALTNLRVDALVKRKRRGIDAVKKLKSDPHKLLSTILIGNNLANIGAAALATSVAFQIIPNHAVAASTGVLTVIVLIFGEIIPKSLATNHSEKISLMVARPILWLSYILYPIVFILEKVTTPFVKQSKEPVLTEEELKAVVDLGQKEGFIKSVEKDIIKKVFKFDEINVSEIMTPRPDMFCVPQEGSLKELLPTMIKSGHTRIPVYKGTINKIVGILNLKSLLPALHNNKSTSIKKVMYPPFFVPETKKVNRMLKDFMDRNEHMAIVVDEHGVISGLVTLENVIEEIVGEIKDETDRKESNVTQINKSTWDVLGRTDVQEANDEMKAKFEDSNEYDTVSGMILHKIQRIPKLKEKVEVGKFKITITEITGNRIEKVRIKKK